MRQFWLFVVMFVSGCASEQQFTLIDPSSQDSDLSSSQIVVEGRTTMHYSVAKEHWYQTVFPFLPILTADPALGSRDDVDFTVERVVKGSEERVEMKFRNYRPLTEKEIASLPYPNDVMEILGGEMLIRVGYDKRSGDRFTNLRLVVLGNTPAMNDALRHATTLPASRRARNPDYRGR
jgi:hypothetical protein